MSLYKKQVQQPCLGWERYDGLKLRCFKLEFKMNEKSCQKHDNFGSSFGWKSKTEILELNPVSWIVTEYGAWKPVLRIKDGTEIWGFEPCNQDERLRVEYGTFVFLSSGWKIKTEIWGLKPKNWDCYTGFGTMCSDERLRLKYGALNPVFTMKGWKWIWDLYTCVEDERLIHGTLCSGWKIDTNMGFETKRLRL